VIFRVWLTKGECELAGLVELPSEPVVGAPVDVDCDNGDRAVGIVELTTRGNGLYDGFLVCRHNTPPRSARS
jgi:hypothetical protein